MSFPELEGEIQKVNCIMSVYISINKDVQRLRSEGGLQKEKKIKS